MLELAGARMRRFEGGGEILSRLEDGAGRLNFVGEEMVLQVMVDTADPPAVGFEEGTRDRNQDEGKSRGVEGGHWGGVSDRL